MVLANGRLRAERVILGVRPSSYCLGSHPIREEFLSAPIHSPPGRLIGPSHFPRYFDSSDYLEKYPENRDFGLTTI
jgi:hypothetical protein